MMLNVSRDQQDQERAWISPGAWAGPGLVSAILLGVLGWVLSEGEPAPVRGEVVGPEEVGLALFGPYLIGVQLAALLLLAGLVGASHLRRHERRTIMSGEEDEPTPARTESGGGKGGPK
jgi:NADH-quinone oxidoreductase subunit J